MAQTLLGKTTSIGSQIILRFSNGSLEPSARVILTQNQEAIIDLVDAPLIRGIRWCACKDKDTGIYYATQHGRNAMHRRLLGAEKGVMVDHWDSDGLNNKRSNLRICNNSLNRANIRKSKRNQSGFKGVAKVKECERWRAKLAQVYLGLFDSPEKAARAYDRAAVERYGQFAKLNFPGQVG